LVDTENQEVGAEVTTGFYELGNGLYQWTYAGFPDDFRGVVKFYEQGTTDVLYIEGVNPEDQEAAVDVEAARVAAVAAKAAAESTDTKLSEERLGLIDDNLDAKASEVLAAAGAAQTASESADGKLDAKPTAEEIDEALSEAHGEGDWAGIGLSEEDAATLAGIRAKTDLIGSQAVEFSGPIEADGSMELVQGDDYLVSNGKALGWAVENWGGPNLEGATVRLVLVTQADYEAGSLEPALEVVGSCQLAGVDATFTAELTGAQTAALEASPPEAFYNYVAQLRVTTAAGAILTIATGAVHVAPGL
jgi:hypothetical protein